MFHIYIYFIQWFRDLLGNGTSFEVVNDGEDLSLGEDDSNDAQESEFYFKEYLNNPKFHNEAILKSVGQDENFGNFEDLLKEMKDVTPDGKIKKLVFSFN